MASTNITPEEVEYIKKIPMLFILGKGRSGTSLLQNLLNAHPRITAGPESRFAVIFYPLFGHIKKWKESDIIDFVNKLYLEPLFNLFWELDKNELTQTLLSVKDVASYELLCKIVYYQRSKGKDNLIYISDKNPEYVLYLDTIEKIFPEAKFVHIVREPRDNVYSQIISFKVRNIAFRAYQWLSYNMIVEERKKKEPSKYYTVLYENLVRDTEGTMKLICNFLHIDFEGTMVQNNAPQWLNSHIERRGITDKDKLIHRNLLKPINTSNVGKWKNKMTPNDQAITEIITGDYAHKVYGYDIDGNKDNKPVKISWLVMLKGRCLYYSWVWFSRKKATHFWFNLYYSRLKRKLMKNIPVWDYF